MTKNTLIIWDAVAMTEITWNKQDAIAMTEITKLKEKTKMWPIV